MLIESVAVLAAGADELLDVLSREHLYEGAGESCFDTVYGTKQSLYLLALVQSSRHSLEQDLHDDASGDAFYSHRMVKQVFHVILRHYVRIKMD